MKKKLIQAATLLIVTVSLFLQQGCKKDVCTNVQTYTYFVPEYKTVAEVRANIKSNAPRPIQNPGKIYIKGNYIFLNELDKGIHVINNSNPAAPVKLAFIDLPGNVDIAVKENTLYADFYTDLVAMDISNPLDVVVKKFVDNIFPERSYYGYMPETGKVIVNWVKKTKTAIVRCDSAAFGFGGGVVYNTMDAGLSASTAATASPTGISGSMARFSLVNNYLYSVSWDSLRITNVSNTQNPVRANSIGLGWGIETLYPFKDKLFIGSTTGMFIYGLQDPLRPVKLGSFAHIRTCDPVIADDSLAYVTLRSGGGCGNTFANQMDVLDITNVLQPALLKSYPFTSPRGLSKDGNLLFVCDGSAGLKVLNAANVQNITLIKTFPMNEATDVIAFNNIALVVANDGLYQYDYSNAADIKLVSKLAVQH